MIMTKEKSFFERIKKSIKAFEEVIYYEPLSEAELNGLEHDWDIKFRPILREFLLAFGFTQDVVKKLKMDKEGMKENLDFLKEINLNNYVPIKSKLTLKRDLIIALKNDDLEDDYLYEIEVGSGAKFKRIQKKKRSFTDIIEKAVKGIKVKKRSKNINKIRVTEFKITSNLEELLLGLKESRIKQVTKWTNKYYPENPFGDMIAKFVMLEQSLIFQRDETGLLFTFDIEEPILTDRNESLIKKTSDMLEKSKLSFEKMECDLIEIE